ncbi:outer membrane lipoprotein LolB [Albitalea terrae]|uniref:Outer-membrane lipoprotein LolB n=1 Tax=Piscinibacter terrae TaxID=2496871 RepID=A0A3N7HQJ5_9BURK|nr:outer membrane lipoprotein LolB [Albitalea terrae]
MRRAWLAALVAAIVLAGCATQQATGPRQYSTPDSLAGRMTVKVDATPTSQARNVTAVFDLQGTPEQGKLDLSTPLGTVLAQARWAPGKVALVTSQGETAFATLDELTREVLGESLPVAALFDWLRGRPWPGAPSTSDGDKAFKQLGWTVSLAQFGDGLIAASRAEAPAVSVRAKLDAQ